MPNQRACSPTCLSKQETTRLQSSELSTPLPLDAILLAIDINRKLVTIHTKSKVGSLDNLDWSVQVIAHTIQFH